MIKWVVLALALMNAGYLSFQLSAWAEIRAGDEDEGNVPQEPDTNGGLVLLTELHGETLRRRRPAPLPGPDAAVVTSPENTEDVASAVTAQSMASGQPPADGAVAQCFTVGPLDDAAPMDAMQRWFDARGIHVRRRGPERRDVSMHWVFLPPFATHEEAVATALEMRANGIKDLHVLRKGDMAHAISLGVFGHEDSMQRRVRDLQKKGYNPATARRYSGTVAGWMDVAAGEKMQETDFREAFQRVNIAARPCEPEDLETALRAGGAS